MDAISQISALIFSAFLKCPTKAHLLSTGEPAPDAFFVDIEARISSLYKAADYLFDRTRAQHLLERSKCLISRDAPENHLTNSLTTGAERANLGV